MSRPGELNLGRFYDRIKYEDERKRLRATDTERKLMECRKKCEQFGKKINELHHELARLKRDSQPTS